MNQHDNQRDPKILHVFPKTSCYCVELNTSAAHITKLYSVNGRFGEQERSVRVARGPTKTNSSFSSALQTSQVHHDSMIQR